VHGLSAKALANRFQVSADAIGRHARNHLTPAQRAAILTAAKPASDIDLDALRISESEGLLHHLVQQRARLLQRVEMAAELGDVKASVSAEGAILSNLQTVGRLLKQLVTSHHVTHSSILVSEDWLRLRQGLQVALRSFPAAAQAVAEYLARADADAARDITAAAQRKAPVLIEATALPPPIPPCPLPPPC
jgi:hypothetical protein